VEVWAFELSSKFQVQGSETQFKVPGSKFKVQKSEFQVPGSKFKAQGSDLTILNSDFSHLASKEGARLCAPTGKFRPPASQT
jgi:hypothetical protein